VISVDRAEELADARGVGNRWMVPDDDGSQGTAKVGAYVPFGAAGGDGVAEDLATFGA
jgi:hypothetical protein